VNEEMTGRKINPRADGYSGLLDAVFVPLKTENEIFLGRCQFYKCQNTSNSFFFLK
jgi:hypothetical protein